MISQVLANEAGTVYIFAQVFGAFLGALVVYVQYKQPLDALTEAAKASPGGVASVFSPAGVSPGWAIRVIVVLTCPFPYSKPAGNFAFFTAPGQSLGYVFINEFVANVVMGERIPAVKASGEVDSGL